ncbi:MBL fold metallo-hydrolase [Allosaccharopolyspora coralli]|uniref:MBL fold metallo-hydrolase n=1 Tax=Allosaccharopolyspora coralli TaxID=2665642 RepID=UPI001E33D111|nr:MBL fold metallo-hydrolase [Allosaccharopolyspora coralli]
MPGEHTQPLVRVVETSTLGDRSYVAGDGTVSVVVDPQRDVDRILAAAGEVGPRVALVLETHLHNDYVSGGLELARLTGAEYGMSADEVVGFDHRPLRDEDVLTVSDRLRVRVVATPGHTFHHLSYVLEHDGHAAGVFTGGSLLYGTTGRTDLLGDEHREELARHQHASARRLTEELPDGAKVWPTHGFGSFCAAGAAGTQGDTVGDQRRDNPALTLAQREFVDHALSGLDVYPAYYAHMGAINAAGPPTLDLRPPHRASPEELTARLDAGEWVVDLRSRKAYMSTHLAGTVSLGLDGPMATWLGWLAERDAAVTLVGSSPAEVAEAQRELCRIGRDEFAAAAVGKPDELAADPTQLRSIPTATFADLVDRVHSRKPTGHPTLPHPDVVLDVRANTEWQAGHLEGATHLPLYALPERMNDVPAGTVWVHCASGYRAAAAASLLAAAGRQVVHVDSPFDTAEEAGATVVRPS